MCNFLVCGMLPFVLYTKLKPSNSVKSGPINWMLNEVADMRCVAAAVVSALLFSISWKSKLIQDFEDHSADTIEAAQQLYKTSGKTAPALEAPVFVAAT